MRAELTRRTQGLTDAHKNLIRLLAAIAVESYLAEIDTPNEIVQKDITMEPPYASR